MGKLLTDIHFTLTLFVLAVLWGIVGLLEIKRRNKDIGYTLIYAAATLLFFDLMIILYANYKPVMIPIIIRY